MLSEPFLQFVLYLGVCVVIRCFQGSYRSVGYFRNLFIFHFVEISQAEYDALLFGKSLDGLVELSLEFVAIEADVFVDLSFEQGRGGVKRYECLELLLAQMIEYFIGAVSPKRCFTSIS